MSESTEFGIIVNEEHEFSVWRTQRHLPPGWRFTGITGTEAEMTALVQQQFVKTTPGTDIAPDRRFNASQWEDTPFEASQWEDTPFEASQWEDTPFDSSQ